MAGDIADLFPGSLQGRRRPPVEYQSQRASSLWRTMSTTEFVNGSANSGEAMSRCACRDFTASTRSSVRIQNSASARRTLEAPSRGGHPSS